MKPVTDSARFKSRPTKIACTALPLGQLPDQPKTARAQPGLPKRERMSTPKPSQYKIKRFNPPLVGSQSNGTPKSASRGPSYTQARTSQAGAGGPAEVGTVSGAGDWLGWEVQWRNQQGRKNKTWEK